MRSDERKVTATIGTNPFNASEVDLDPAEPQAVRSEYRLGSVDRVGGSIVVPVNCGARSRPVLAGELARGNWQEGLKDYQRTRALVVM